jgi:hypothetical protein
MKLKSIILLLLLLQFSLAQGVVEQLEMQVEFRTCLTETISECIENEPLQELTVEYGVPLLLTYRIPLTEELEQIPPHINLTVNGELLVSRDSNLGNLLFRQMQPGYYNLTISASHPAYIDSRLSKEIFIKPGLSGQVSLRFFPGDVNVRIGDPITFNLTVNNSLNFPQNFTIFSNLNATFESPIYLDAGETKSYPVYLGPTEEEGSFILNLTLNSSDISLNVVSNIIVEEERIYNATIIPSTTDLGLKVLVTNTGTVLDNYTLSTCNGNTSLTLEPGDSRSFPIGNFDSPCEICLDSDYFFKCMTITPISMTIAIPTFIQTELNKQTEIPFQTNATIEGKIFVEVDSPWIDDFTCTATCDRTVTFTPNRLGDFKINFHIKWIETGLEGTAETEVNVLKGFSIPGDQEKINDKIDLLESRISILEDQGISSPAAESIIGQVKRTQPETPEEVAEILGELERADKYIDYARDFKMPRPRGIPLTQVVIGVSALLVGISAIYITYHYKSNPYHPVYQKLGISPKKPEGRGEKFMKNEFKGSDLPRLR